MIEFTVQDMTCGHCAATIQRAVLEADVAASCEVDVPARRVRISGDGPAERFQGAIARAGYTPVAVPRAA